MSISVCLALSTVFHSIIRHFFKKETKSDPGNHRPGSLTCVACKLLESFARDAVVDHMADNSLYSECQHGFRKHRSCVTQLLEVIEDFMQQFNNGCPVVVVYLDLKKKKAFDTVPHQRLMCKLASYGQMDRGLFVK